MVRHLLVRRIPDSGFTLCKEIGLTLAHIARELPGPWHVPDRIVGASGAMRKILAVLDDEQREALLELTDFGIAAFSAGLAVALLKSAVDFIALFF
jgi:hypothetical protein